MGAHADEQMRLRCLREIAGSRFADASDIKIEELSKLAEDLARTDQMPFPIAMQKVLASHHDY